MSLVIAYIGARGAAMAGDMREISFGGEPGAVAALEGELYEGTITDDEALHRRAAALEVALPDPGRQGEGEGPRRSPDG
jgi:hypothetical protein